MVSAMVLTLLRYKNQIKSFSKNYEDNSLFFRDGAVAFLINILIYDVTRSEMLLGWFTAVMTLITATAYWIAGKLASWKIYV